MSVLNLPTEKQQVLAKKQGLSLEAWRKKIQNLLVENKSYTDKLETVELKGREAKKYMQDNPRFSEPVA